MRTGIFKKIFAVILTLTVILPIVAITSFADTSVSLSVEDVGGVKANDAFQVSVKYTGSAAVQISGISLVIAYDESKVAFSGNSEKIFVKNMDGCTISNKNGKVRLIWDSLDKVTLTSGKLFQFTFAAKSSFSDTVITPSVEMLYVFEGNAMKDIAVGTMTGGSITGNAVNNVNAVIAAINAIDNPVVYTDACNERIISAWNKYTALSGSEKPLVTNYSTLANAIKEYNRLREQSGNDSVNAEVEKYKQEHSYALSRTKLNVTTDKNADGSFKDVVALETAITEMEKLSVQAQAKLMPQKNTLKSVLAFLKAQIKDELEEQERAELEKKQRAAAEEAVNDFLSQPFKWVFDLTPETVKTGDETGVRNALSALGDYEINKYAVEMLADKKELLEKLIKKIEELKISQNPEKAAEIKAADAFKDNFSYVLSLTPETVTRDDEIDVNIANYAYEMLDDGVKALLQNEGQLLSSLMDAIAELPQDDTDSDEDSDGDTAAEIDENDNSGDSEGGVKEIIKRIKDSAKYTVKFVTRNMSNIIWVMLAVIGVLLINFGFCYGFYRRALKHPIDKEADIDES